nr:MAG TPA: hypothetical protein [Caudoviricetes sp.]
MWIEIVMLISKILIKQKGLFTQCGKQAFLLWKFI